jgi:hypothetical protein
MSGRTLLHGGIAGLLVALGGLVGCESGGGPPLPETGGAGIPGVRGPVGPNMPKGAPGKARPVIQRPGPAGRGAPAPTPAPGTPGTGETPAAPKE